MSLVHFGHEKGKKNCWYSKVIFEVLQQKPNNVSFFGFQNPLKIQFPKITLTHMTTHFMIHFLFFLSHFMSLFYHNSFTIVKCRAQHHVS